jgi:hypothetical protein
MKLTLNVTTTDNNYEVTTIFANIVEWERKMKRQASDLARGIGYDDLAFLAWAASKSAGVTVPLVYDDFVKKIVALDVVDNEPQNPTPPEAGVTA